MRTVIGIFGGLGKSTVAEAMLGVLPGFVLEKRPNNDKDWYISKVAENYGDLIIDDIQYLHEIETIANDSDVFYLIKVEACPEIVSDTRYTTVPQDDELDEYDAIDCLINNTAEIEDLETQALWAANDVLITMISRIGSAQRDLMDSYLGILTIDTSGDDPMMFTPD